MNRQPQIPTSRMKEADADRLIANFGVKPPDHDRQKIKNSLRTVKREFVGMEHERRRTRSGPERGL